LLAIMLTPFWFAQETTVPTTQTEHAQQIGERDKKVEDEVAKLFESIRRGAKVPMLKRIGHRTSLEQQVCTIAVSGKAPKYASTNTAAFYKIANPQSITPELNRVASFDQLHRKHNPPYKRYSVAVWRIEGQDAGARYWVGVQLYWSAATEFVDSHFTDDIYYHNDWKKLIDPLCRGK
jgi:hypothetical protein